MSTAATKFDAGVTKIQKGLGKMEDKFKATGAKMANLQTGLASLGAGAFLKGALDESTAFQKSLNLTQAVTGATAEQIDMMREKALDWGASTQFSSGQVASAMAELGKMGNKTNEIIDLMPGTMALAAAGEIEMAEAANFTMGILNQFNMGLDKAGNVADILATGASGAATSVGGLASAMNNTGLQASMAGLSIEDTTAALMAMASKNIEGAEAGTLFKNAVKSLMVMTDKTRGGFEKMGIDIDNFRDSTTGQMTDFYGLIEAMKATGETGGRIMAETFDIRALQAFSAITGTTTDAMNGYRDSLANVEGNAQAMQDTLLNGIEHMVTFESVTQNLKVMMGSWLNESLAPVLNKFNEWLGSMQKNNPEMLKLITYVLMGVTALGAILIPLGLVISSIGAIIGVIKTIIGLTKVWTAVQGAFNLVMGAGLAPILAIVAAVAALIAIVVLVIKNWDDLKLAGAMALDFIIEKVQALIGWFGGLGDKIGESFGKVKDFFGGIGEKVGGLFNRDDAVTSPYMARTAPAPILSGYGGSVSADASVSVYTSKDVEVEPFKATGNLGYNMSDRYSRGM